jgi:hypothetical protein
MQQERGYIPHAKTSSFQQYHATRSASTGAVASRQEGECRGRAAELAVAAPVRAPPGDAAEEVPCLQIEASREEEEGERGDTATTSSTAVEATSTASEHDGRGGGTTHVRSAARLAGEEGPRLQILHSAARLDVHRAVRRGGHLQLYRAGSGEWPFLGGFRRPVWRRRPGGWRRWRRRRWGSLRWPLLRLAPAVELLCSASRLAVELLQGMPAVRGLVVLAVKTGSDGGAMGELGREGVTAEGVARTGTDGGGEADDWNCGGCRSARTPQECITPKAFAHFAASDAATVGGGTVAFCSAYQRCRC